ncbi:SDR family NAD(P)-dependent oxidoreductase, partial [Escherichia coli]
MSVLVTGGAGYIGSHTVLTLLQKGIDVIVIDDFSNSSLESLERVKKITNRDIKVYKGDVADLRLLNLIFSNHDIHTVIHFAGSKSVGESISKPIHYYNNNVVASLVLI